MKRVVWLVVILLFFTAPALALAAKDYSASGLVLQVDRAHRSVEVSCEAIPGQMDAVVMTLAVEDAKTLDGLKPGMMIDFAVAAHEHENYAKDIRVHPYENAAQEPMADRQLKILEEATSHSPAAPALEIGQPVPDFTLVDQNRQSVTFSHFAGKVVAITFIYTSCPLPNFCFRMSNNFGVLQKRNTGRMGKDLVLLSITFDPEHDQPDVLAEYARTWTKDQTGWYFLTGPLPDVQKVCRAFGMNFWQDEGFLTHSLHTVVIDRQGRIAANLEGNEYTAKQLGDLVDSIIQRSR
jgi:protein SCO1/2